MQARVDDRVRGPDARNMTPNLSTATASAEVMSGRSVFIVDDDPVLVEALTELLREEGYRVEAHTDATSALDRLRAGVRPDVVLLDYLMPAMNGEEFLEALESADIRVKVMLFTAMHEPRIRARGGLVRGMIRKPFDIDRLLAELERLRSEEPGR
jgi:CheY-like chemotaxis protein